MGGNLLCFIVEFNFFMFFSFLNSILITVIVIDDVYSSAAQL